MSPDGAEIVGGIASECSEIAAQSRIRLRAPEPQQHLVSTQPSAACRLQSGQQRNGFAVHGDGDVFASLGALRFDQGTNYTGNVPSAAQRKGNFQENLATDISTCAQSPSAADNAAFKFLVCNPATHTPYAAARLAAGCWGRG